MYWSLKTNNSKLFYAANIRIKKNKKLNKNTYFRESIKSWFILYEIGEYTLRKWLSGFFPE